MAPERDELFEAFVNGPDLPPPREVQGRLIIELDHFNYTLTRFRVGNGTVRLHELPDFLRERLTFVVKRLEDSGLDQLTYDERPLGTLVISTELPEGIREAAEMAARSFADAVWHVQYYQARQMAFGRDKWRCPDCREMIPIKQVYCNRRACEGHEHYARCTGKHAPINVLPDARTANER